MPTRMTVIGSLLVVALAGAASAAAIPTATAPHVQSVGLTIREGDRLSGSGNIALAPGVPVRLTVRNYTRQFHTFTIPGLHLNRLIPPARGQAASTTLITFTTRKWGAFAWHCLICPSGMHGHAHQMGGTLYLVVDPSALP